MRSDPTSDHSTGIETRSKVTELDVSNPQAGRIRCHSYVIIIISKLSIAYRLPVNFGTPVVWRTCILVHEIIAAADFGLLSLPCAAIVIMGARGVTEVERSQFLRRNIGTHCREINCFWRDRHANSGSTCQAFTGLVLTPFSGRFHCGQLARIDGAVCRVASGRNGNSTQGLDDIQIAGFSVVSPALPSGDHFQGREVQTACGYGECSRHGTRLRH